MEFRPLSVPFLVQLLSPLAFLTSRCISRSLFSWSLLSRSLTFLLSGYRVFFLMIYPLLMLLPCPSTLLCRHPAGTVAV